MGRYNFAAQRVHSSASQLLGTNKFPTLPPWFGIVQQYPPSERLTRPPLQRTQAPHARRGRAHRKPSRMFQPVKLEYEEDRLRYNYFNDHPWELARPRVILEDDGRDLQKWDWSLPLSPPPRHELLRQFSNMQQVYEWERWYHNEQQKQCSRPINGESVVQRQRWLVSYGGLSSAMAYDVARKELYRARHAREIEDRIAKEEALHSGAYFGLGPLEIGMHLEDQAFETWKVWAEKEIEQARQRQVSVYTGGSTDEDDGLSVDEAGLEDPVAT